MVETEKHLILKERARKELLKDFTDKQIFFEYAINIDNKKYIVDVVGISSDSKVAIECGILRGENRTEILSECFDKVIHYPYLGRRLIKLPRDTIQKCYAISKMQDRRMKNIMKKYIFNTQSELFRKIIDIGLERIEKEIDLHKGVNNK